MPRISYLKKTDHVKPLTGLSSTLVALGSTESDVINLDSIDEIVLVVQVTCTFNDAATGDLTVKLLTSMDGTTFDDADDPLASGSIPVQAGTTATKTFQFNVQSPFAKVRLENGDATYSITGISGSYYVPPRQPLAERP